MTPHISQREGYCHGCWYEESSEILKIDLLYDPVILLLRIYYPKVKSAYEKVICAPMFVAA